MSLMQNPSQHCSEQTLKIHQSCCSLAFVTYRIIHPTKTIALCYMPRVVLQPARLYGSKPFPSIRVAHVCAQSGAAGGAILPIVSTVSRACFRPVSVGRKTATPSSRDRECVYTKQILGSLYTLVFLCYGGVCFGVFQFWVGGVGFAYIILDVCST